jgi:hypothetical protein
MRARHLAQFPDSGRIGIRKRFVFGPFRAAHEGNRAHLLVLDPIDAVARWNMLARVFSTDRTTTHLPPPPRKVHGGFGCGLWFGRLFIMPHMCVGVAMAGRLILTVLAAVYGKNLVAKVTDTHTSRGSKGGTTYHVAYTYSVEGREYSDTDTVRAGTYEALRNPKILEGRAATVRVRYLGSGPLHFHVLTQDGSAWGAVGFLLFFVLFWNGLLSVFVYVLWVAPIRQRSLIRNGEVTAGTIVSSRVHRGKGTTYYATFRFRDPERGEEITQEMQVPGEAQHSALKPGFEVTVLYDPSKPKRATVYEFCGYKVDGAQPV